MWSSIAVLTMVSIMTSCSAAPAVMRRSLAAQRLSSIFSLTGGRIEIVIFGNQHALDLVAPEIAKVRALRAVDANGHDHGVALVGDHGGAVINLHQAAGDGDAAFREDHQRLAARNEMHEVAGRERLATDRAYSAGSAS